MAEQQLHARRNGLVAQDRRPAAVAVVEPDHPEATVGEPLAELVLPEHHLGAETHDQQQRGLFANAEGLEAELDVTDVGALLVWGGLGRHRGPCSSSIPPAPRSNAECSARTACGTASERITHEILIGEVEIISM